MPRIGRFAIASLRLFTRRPARPDLSLPSFISRNARSAIFPALGPYLRLFRFATSIGTSKRSPGFCRYSSRGGGYKTAGRNRLVSVFPGNTFNAAACVDEPQQRCSFSGSRKTMNTRKCANESCYCEVEGSQTAFCSSKCTQASDDVERCACGHPVCGTGAGWH